MMSLLPTLEHALSHVYHEDLANAAMHTAPVKFSPITFRLAEQISELEPDTQSEIVRHVLGHAGQYAEDTGR